MIDVSDLGKDFRVHKRQAGLGATLRAVFARRTETVRAVDGLSFHIAAGERVGFLGPNGAGKTTTLKMLAGLLHPTRGRVVVGGHRPQDRRVEFLKLITLVMGQKQQLLWDLPPVDTYALNAALFDVPDRERDAVVAELVELLAIGDLVRKPTRQLSLGERMKCELVAALLHRPKVLFLDEPTIGLDVTMQARMREFVRAYNQRHGATVLLTSHYMEDVTALCPRVIVIDQGRLLHDGDLRALVQRLRPDKRVTVRTGVPADRERLEKMGRVLESGEGVVVLGVPYARVNEVVRDALAQCQVSDINIEEPPLEEVMRDLFRGAGAAAPPPGAAAGRPGAEPGGPGGPAPGAPDGAAPGPAGDGGREAGGAG